MDAVQSSRLKCVRGMDSKELSTGASSTVFATQVWTRYGQQGTVNWSKLNSLRDSSVDAVWAARNCQLEQAQQSSRLKCGRGMDSKELSTGASSSLHDSSVDAVQSQVWTRHGQQGTVNWSKLNSLRDSSVDAVWTARNCQLEQAQQSSHSAFLPVHWRCFLTSAPEDC